MNRRSMTLAILAVCLSAGAAVGVNHATKEIQVANACYAKCRAKHDQCRIKTKGSPSCDGKLQACLDRCRGG